MSAFTLRIEESVVLLSKGTTEENLDMYEIIEVIKAKLVELGINSLFYEFDGVTIRFYFPSGTNMHEAAGVVGAAPFICRLKQAGPKLENNREFLEADLKIFARAFAIAVTDFNWENIK